MCTVNRRAGCFGHGCGRREHGGAGRVNADPFCDGLWTMMGRTKGQIWDLAGRETPRKGNCGQSGLGRGPRRLGYRRSRSAIRTLIVKYRYKILIYNFANIPFTSSALSLSPPPTTSIPRPLVCSQMADLYPPSYPQRPSQQYQQNMAYPPPQLVANQHSGSSSNSSDDSGEQQQPQQPPSPTKSNSEPPKTETKPQATFLTKLYA